MEELVISDRKKIVVRHAKFGEMDTLDIRTWIETPNYKGPTRKGVNIPITKAEELTQKILKVIKEPAEEVQTRAEQE